jgi:hypothetical protein
LTNSDAEGTVVHNVKKEEWQEENNEKSEGRWRKEKRK